MDKFFLNFRNALDQNFVRVLFLKYISNIGLTYYGLFILLTYFCSILHSRIVQAQMDVLKLPFFSQISELLFPHTCLHCDKELAPVQYFLCASCWEKTTAVTGEKELILARVTNTVNLESGHALFEFDKDTPIQTLLHQLKYKHKKTIGNTLGILLGEKLVQNQVLDVDLIVPIPIHFKKKFQRGYNQSALIAKGVSKVIGIDVEESFLKCRKKGTSQTQKNKEERKLNVENKFIVKSVANNFQHILLIDDILTTGATIESAAQEILKTFPDKKISFACVAITC